MKEYVTSQGPPKQTNYSHRVTGWLSDQEGKKKNRRGKKKRKKEKTPQVEFKTKGLSAPKAHCPG